MDTSPYKPRRKWPLILGILVVALIGAWFVVTSSGFLRAVVLPRVASALHSDLTVGDISFSPFSALTLRQVKLTPTGAETLATVAEVRLRYSLMAILRGTLTVSEATLDTPVITVVGRPDGTSNLSHLLDSLGKDPSPPENKSPGEPSRIDLRNISLKNGTLRQTSVGTNGPGSVELTGINLSLDQLANGGSGKLTVSSGLGMTADGTNALTGQLEGALQLGVDDRLAPKAVNGALDLKITSAAGAFREFGKVGAKLTVDSTGAELREVRLAISESGEAVGELRLSGPFDLEKKEARIAYELKGIDRKALGIAGAIAGVDLGQTRISAEGRLDLAQRGQLFASQGKFAVNQLTVGTATGTTPALEIALDYKVQVNLEDKTALVEKADLSVQQGARPIIQGSLDRPMNIAWDAAAPGFREATYTLSVKQLELAPWRTVAGPGLPAGFASLEATVTSDRDGRLLKFTASSGLNQLVVETGGQTIRDLALTLKASGSIEDFKVFVLEKAEGEATLGVQPLAKYNAFAHANFRNQDLGGQASLDAQLPATLRAYPVAGVALTSGTARFTAQVGIKPGQTNGSVGLSLTGLVGEVFGAVLQEYEAKFDATVGMGQGKAMLQRGTLSLRSGSDAGGSLDLSGDYDLNTQRGEFDFKTVNLNEKALGPFVASAVKPNELKSISLDLNGQAQVDLKAQSTLKAALQVSRLVARDPSGRLPGDPLAFGLDLDAIQRGQTLDLRQLLVTLPATTRARNELRATGKFDFATNNAAPSTLNLSSAALDFTPLYNLFAGDGAAPAAAPKAEEKPGAAPGEPIKLPLEQFTVDAKLDAIFLREIAVSNLVTKVEINRGKIAVNPFSLSLNGAPATATALLDVGVPGYTYDLGAHLQAVPVPPFAKSFLSGQLLDLHGTFGGKLALKGAGLDGAALRQHLVGTAEFAATNLDYQISSLKTPLMKSLVTTLMASLRLPQLSESPINALAVQISAGQGVVNVSSAQVTSPAFVAQARGEIRLADILTNSPINIPITVSLPKDGKLQELPGFLTMKGTVGVPRPDIDALALARTLTSLPGAAGELSNLGVEKLGSALDKALGGKGGTNAGPASGLLKSFLGGPTPATNSPATATNTPATTNSPTAPAPFNPLDLFKKPAKK